ncbi:MAG: peptidase domain-containing ABC transporter [bacterium]|nr:peptidase domain-containing ABC transporter [bacterium]
MVLQNGNKDCGAATLLSIIRFYGGNVSLDYLIELTNTTKDGTTFFNLQNAATTVSLNSKAFKVESLTNLDSNTFPCICQVINNNFTHFVVLYQLTKKNVVLMDPAMGKRVISISDFLEMWTNYIMVFQPMKPLPNIKDHQYLLETIKSTLKNNKKVAMNILLLSITFTIFTCIYSFYFKIVIDEIVNTSVSNLIVCSLIFLSIILLKNITDYFRNQLLIYLNQKLDVSLILNTFKKILLLPYSYFKNKTTGEVISRINDLAYVKSMISNVIVTVILDMMLVLAGGVILFLLSKTLFLVTCIIALLYVLCMIVFWPLLKKKIDSNLLNNSLVNSFLVESINGYETVKGMNLENKVQTKMEHLYVKYLKEMYRFESLSNLQMFVKESIGSIGTLIIIFVGGNLVMMNKMSIGLLVSYTTLLGYFLNPFRAILEFDANYYYAKKSLKRANNMFYEDSIDLTTMHNLQVTGDIKINNLCFAFDGRNDILKSINLTIKAGQRVLILGNSGSGKSTLLKILLKYYNVGRNSVFINDIDINDYSYADVKRGMSYISQNEILYTDTIKNNIIIGRENATYDELIDVCKLMEVDEIVKTNILGYDMMLEENGANISGGQRQRIILARTCLRCSDVNLIDEGLNELDINLERRILKRVFTKYNKQTFIVVTHRLENIDLYDKVIRLEMGSIKEVITKTGDNNG